jgi:hypothetical protein
VDPEVAGKRSILDRVARPAPLAGSHSSLPSQVKVAESRPPLDECVQLIVPSTAMNRNRPPWPRNSMKAGPSSSIAPLSQSAISTIRHLPESFMTFTHHADPMRGSTASGAVMLAVVVAPNAIPHQAARQHEAARRCRSSRTAITDRTYKLACCV